MKKKPKKKNIMYWGKYYPSVGVASPFPGEPWHAISSIYLLAPKMCAETPNTFPCLFLQVLSSACQKAETECLGILIFKVTFHFTAGIYVLCLFRHPREMLLWTGEIAVYRHRKPRIVDTIEPLCW